MTRINEEAAGQESPLIQNENDNFKQNLVESLSPDKMLDSDYNEKDEMFRIKGNGKRIANFNQTTSI